MDGSIPLPTLLSHTLVAFTIEFDNEAEHHLPHQTTNHGSTADSPRAPWLVSMVMWFNCMRFVDDKGIPARELGQLAHTQAHLHGMRRWGYISIKPDPNDSRPKPPASEWLIRPTRGGRKAQEVWRPLFGTIENRWRERFGEGEIKQLRAALGTIIEQLDDELPDCLPIIAYDLFSASRGVKLRKAADGPPANLSSLPLSSLLSKVLLAFAIEFESESKVSLAICANVLRLVGEAVRVRDLPRLAGVSKEGMAMAFTFLLKQGYAVVKPESTESRFKVVQLTPKGRKARKTYFRLIGEIEERWKERVGANAIAELRRSLEKLVGEPGARSSPLFQGLEPYPDGWRAAVRKPEVLPDYPMVLHRGGFPDGS